MNGVTIIETEKFDVLLNAIATLEETFKATAEELKQLKDPYLTTKDVMAITRCSEKWVQDNKDRIGSTVKGGKLIFKRKDVIEFMEEGYYKLPKPKRDKYLG